MDASNITFPSTVTTETIDPMDSTTTVELNPTDQDNKDTVAQARPAIIVPIAIAIPLYLILFYQ